MHYILLQQLADKLQRKNNSGCKLGTFRHVNKVIITCIIIIINPAEKLSEKNEGPYHITITWIRTLLSFET